MIDSSNLRCTDCVSFEDTADTSPVLEIRRLSVHAGNRTILRDVSLSVAAHQVFGVVGPSGAGKSTLLRAINRLLDLRPGFRVDGSVWLRGRDIYARDADPDELRVRIGFLFQQPVVFPISIEANVLFGLRHHRSLRRSEKMQTVEKSLRTVALWPEDSGSPSSDPKHAEPKEFSLSRVILFHRGNTSSPNPCDTRAAIQKLMNMLLAQSTYHSPRSRQYRM